jgi:hypothetical protein
MSIRQLLEYSTYGLLVALWPACSSPLSDVPISEPSVLRVSALAQHDIGTSGAATSLLQVALFDKHEQWVELKEGGVTVNGLPMSYNGLGAYTRSDVVRPDVNYSFVVTLSDSSKYSCNVHTPLNLYQLNLPASYNRTGPLTVSWLSVDVTAQTVLELSGDSASARYNIPSSQGSFTLQPTDFSQFHSPQTLRVTLSYSKPGLVDYHFMSTSSAWASFSISRNMQLTSSLMKATD